VQGLQGVGSRYVKTVATPKHFAVHSAPESTRHVFDAVVSPRDLQMTEVTWSCEMMCTGDWELSSLAKYAPDLDFGVMPMPYPKDGGRVATWAGGWSVVVPKGAPNAEGGFRFISYFAGPEEMDFFCRETKHIPTLKAAADNPFYTEDPKHKVFMDMLPIANTRPPVPIGQFLWTALAEARDLIIHGVKTPQEALDDVTTKSNEEMKRYL
jgi:multiple sugar transport system substrate-binding protein